MRVHEALFWYNCRGQECPTAAGLLRREHEWITRLLVRSQPRQSSPRDFPEFRDRLGQLLRCDARAPSTDARFLATHATRDQFQQIVREYAPDGLTEASAMCYAVPRLHAAAQMCVARVWVDEYGCGNLRRAHSQLYRDLLEELGLSTRLEDHVPSVNQASLAAVNLWHWLTRRAPVLDYYLGALAYVEAAVPAAFSCFVRTCARLGVVQHHYFTEHVHIDDYHARDALKAVQLTHCAAGLDFGKVWTGVRLARRLGNQAFSAAVRRACKEYAS